MMFRAVIIFTTFLIVAGCAQFTMDDAGRAVLQADADKSGESYVTCVVDAAGRYQQTGESAALIAEVAKKDCAAARSAYADAEERYLKSEYMSTGPILERRLAALDQRVTQQVQVQVLENRTASAPVAAPSAGISAPGVPADGSAYLKCMSAEGQRYAGVNEPATVVAEVAQSRCASQLTDPASSAQLEQQGRALVMGMVLDRKASGQ